jgi:hypothetical protein
MNNQMIQQDLTREDQTLQTVGQIDNQIQSVYNNLEALSVQQNPDLNKQKQLLQKIEELQQLKSSLYTSINNSYAATQSNVAQSRNSLVDETAINGIIGQELTNVNKNLSTLEEARFNKVRMAEINNYYSDKYGAQTNVMKTIVYFCIPILILGILMKKEFIPKNIATALIGILVGLLIIIVIFQAIDIARRNNMVFSEYDFPFNSDNVDLNGESNNDDQPKKRDYSMSCVGEACCPDGNDFGTLWDNNQKKCVTPSYETSQSEPFVGERCLQNSFNKADFNVNIFKNNNQEVKGYSDDSNFAKV